MIPRDQLEHWLASKRIANAVDDEVFNIIVSQDKRIADLEERVELMMQVINAMFDGE